MGDRSFRSGLLGRDADAVEQRLRALADPPARLAEAIGEDTRRRAEDRLRLVDRQLSQCRGRLERRAPQEPDPVESAGGAEAGDEPESPSSGADPADSALYGPHLVAAQMALAGSTRAEVAEHLERTFDLPGADDIAAEVFANR